MFISLKSAGCLAVLLLLSMVVNAETPWSAKQSYPGNGREGAVSFVIGNYAYVGLGYTGSGVSKDFWRYDPFNNYWTKIADFGGDARENAVVFVINDTAYVGTGDSGYPNYTKYKDFWKYDVSLNAWKRVADFGGTARTGAVAFAIGNKAYVGTGQDDTDALKDLWEYSPGNNIWTKKNDITSDKRKDAVAFSINGKGYICSGWYFVPSSTILSDVQEYNPVTDSWTEKVFADGTLNKKQWCDYFILNNRAYLISGNNTNSAVVYDPVKNILTTVENFGPIGETQRSNPVAFAVNGKGYAGLGSVSSVYKSDLWMYDVQLPPMAPENLTATPVDNSKISLAWTDNSPNETGFVIEKAAYNSNTFVECGTVSTNSVTYVVKELSDSSIYSFRIKAVNSVGSSEYSNIVTDTTLALHPPKAPQNLVCKENGSINLVYDDVSTNETAFHYEYSEGDNQHFIEFTTVPADWVNVYSSFTMKDTTLYFIRVRAKNDAGFSDYSNEFSFTTKARGPSNLLASPKSESNIFLSWIDNSTSESKFTIERSENDSLHYQVIDSLQANTGYSSQMGYNDRTVKSGIKYFYRIIATIKGKQIYGKNQDSALPVESGSWKQLTDYPGDRADDGVGFYYKDTVYMGLGWYGGNQFWAYGEKDGSWKQKANLGGKTWDNASCMVLNDKGYVCLGSFNMNERKRAWEYDFSKNTWTQKKDVPFVDRYGQISFTLENKGYILGGRDYSSYDKIFSDFYRYDITTDTWTQLADFPGGPCLSVPVFIYNEKAYILYNQKDLWEYSPSTNNWFKIKTLKQNVPGYKGLNINESFYIFSQVSYNDNITVYEYNLLNDTLIEKSIFPGQSKSDIVFVQGSHSVYLGCGAGNGYNDEFWEYNPFAPVEPADLTAKAATFTKVELTWRDESNIESGYYIERSNSISPYLIIDSIAPNSTSYTDNSVLQGNYYYYRVRAKGTNGVSAYSNIANCMTKVPTKPLIYRIGTPFNNKKVTIQSSLGDYIDGYIVERSEGVKSSYVVIDTIYTKNWYNNFTDSTSSLVIGNLYSYRIKSFNSLGNSMNSDSVYVMPGSILHSQSEKVKVSKAYYFDINGFDNYYSFNSTTQVIEPAVEGEKVTVDFKDFSLPYKDTLFIFDGPDAQSPLLAKFDDVSKPGYLLCAENASGTLTFLLKSGSYTGRGWKAVVKSTAFPPPANLKAKKVQGIVLSWIDNSESEINYVIERSESDTLHYSTLVTLDANTVTYNDNSVSSSKTYYYRVKAVYSMGESEFSNVSVSDGTTLGLDEKTDEFELSVFPNPAKSNCYLRFNLPEKQNITISIVNLVGSFKEAFDYNLDSGFNELKLNLDKYSNGMYFIIIQFENKRIIKSLSITK